MRRTAAREGVRMARFLNILNRLRIGRAQPGGGGGVAGGERADVPALDAGLTWEAGEAGLVGRRLGRASGRRVPADRAEEVERLYRERHPGFTVKPFHEHLIKDHGFGWGYAWLKLHLQWSGVVPKAPLVDGMDKPPARPPRPQQNRSRRSGHLTRCQNRTSSFAIDTQRRGKIERLLRSPSGAEFAASRFGEALARLALWSDMANQARAGGPTIAALRLDQTKSTEV